MDGLARIWDIREGALKRYGAHIGKRAEYTLSLTDSEKRSLGDDGDNQRMDREGQDDQLLLPPLPQREESIVGRVPPLDPAANVALPPAPGAPDPNDDIGDVNAELRDLENDVEAGAFVANATLDEGVRIVAKLQHGEPLHQDGIGTRSRLKAVKVICVARCPVGGHFATGSDDGICRVWEDQDDERVAVVDSRGKDQLIRNVRRNPSPSISRDAGKNFEILRLYLLKERISSPFYSSIHVSVVSVFGGAYEFDY
jgi:WD40 repeat protein